MLDAAVSISTPGLAVARHDAPAHLVAVHLRQVAVEHDDVVAVHGDPLHGGVAVVADVDGHVHVPQPRRDGVGQQFLILGDQDSHGFLPRSLLSTAGRIKIG